MNGNSIPFRMLIRVNTGRKNTKETRKNESGAIKSYNNAD